MFWSITASILNHSRLYLDPPPTVVSVCIEDDEYEPSILLNSYMFTMHFFQGETKDDFAGESNGVDR